MRYAQTIFCSPAHFSSLTSSQHDLRTHHVCNRSRSACGAPLASYSEQGVKLYSLTVSRSRPEVFVVAGTSPYAFLHDRRMVRRSMQEEWGQTMKSDVMTQCVRRFGLPPEEEVPREQEKRQRRWDAELQITACKLSESNGRDVRLLHESLSLLIVVVLHSSSSRIPAIQFTFLTSLRTPLSPARWCRRLLRFQRQSERGRVHHLLTP